ncbi:flagellar assembly protein FliH [Variovorax sp. TBS-050B]|jgi:flagellar assembly protein FliH|uniref:flagellar assembly protein FliH n=1 Tax=Variovorax sp. TBS-050B TaxID=2940551 RepID=UPI002474F7BF|nr:flagellar assembly protein FliH [Variovorax sp. TBS-050B]MDH6591100.1 flagellar assembly protein FliH [Variovorax sp. TBS-050B]
MTSSDATFGSAAARPRLSAWQRWEMGALEADARAARASAPPPPAPPRRDPALLAREAELQRLRQEARAAGEAEGRREGWAQGHAEGHAEGLAAGLAGAAAHAEQLRALAASLPAALQSAEGELSQAILALALDVARQVIHRTLRVDHDWVLALVQDLLHTEPALQGEPRLLLHPDDVQLVKNSLGSELQSAGWQLRADDSLARGSCRVRCASGEIDATLETRWKRVVGAFSPYADAEGA